MNSSSIIMVGIALESLLIVSCLSLNASEFYNTVEAFPSVELDLKPDIKLRDRTS